jgi:hypothetical protein
MLGEEVTVNVAKTGIEPKTRFKRCWNCLNMTDVNTTLFLFLKSPDSFSVIG